MKFFAYSALATVAAANTYYGGARLATTGLTGLSTGYTTGYSGYNTLAVPALQKVAVVAQPTFAVQKVGLATTGLATGYTGAYNTGYAGAYNTGYAGGYTYGSAAVAPLAVQTTHQVQYQDVPSGGSISPISVDIAANPIPINMVFRSASSQLNVEQAHQGAAGSAQESSSEDEAHVLRHSVTKPVVQEVREVITPFRRITQEIQPVSEQINTIVARGVNQAVVARAAPIAAVQTVAAPVATIQTVTAPMAYNKIVAAPVQTLAATQYVSRPVATQVLTASPLSFQKFGTVNTLGAVNTYTKEY